MKGKFWVIEGLDGCGKTTQMECLKQALENKKIPQNIDYRAIKELSSEAAEKLEKVKPTSIGQASRISGVSPADVNVLMIALELKRRKEQE